MTGLRNTISITLAVLLSGGCCLADQGSSSPFCIVPVQGGAPTEKDHKQAWRMMDKIIMLPGVPRPIIYAIDRGGVWTSTRTALSCRSEENFLRIYFSTKLPAIPTLAASSASIQATVCSPSILVTRNSGSSTALASPLCNSYIRWSSFRDLKVS